MTVTGISYNHTRNKEEGWRRRNEGQEESQLHFLGLANDAAALQQGLQQKAKEQIYVLSLIECGWLLCITMETKGKISPVKVKDYGEGMSL